MKDFISPKMLFLLRNMGKFIKRYNDGERSDELKALGLKIIKKLEKYVDIDDDEKNMHSYKSFIDKDIDLIKDVIQQALQALKETGNE